MRDLSVAALNRILLRIPVWDPKGVLAKRAAAERVVDVARRLVHGERDEDGAPITLESLVAAVSAYEATRPSRPTTGEAR